MITPGFRKRLGRYRQYGGYLELLVPRRRWAYIGWLGHLNAGDDAMYRTHVEMFPSVNFWSAPNVGPNSVLRTTSAAPWVKGPEVTVLGGGTLIGNGHFRHTMSTLLDAFPQTKPVMLSVGVEDPDFEGHRARNTAKELPAWSEILGRFDVVRVRGPRSQEILADHGVHSEVVGDPALMLGEHLTFDRTQERTLGLNVGQTDNMWGSQEQVVATCQDIVRTFVGRGWRVRVYSVWPKDDEIVRSVAAVGNDSAEAILYEGDLDGLLKSMGECTVFVGEKLHAVVLASCAEVPSIALEYRPKCRDFQASLRREEWTMRTNELEHDRLVDMIDSLTADRDASSNQIRFAINDLRVGIRDAAADITSRST